MSFEIYCNYGVLGAEKRNVYTYGVEHSQATTSDKMTVELPENQYFSLYENAAGELMVEASWGWNYEINEVLSGNSKPCFSAFDKGGKEHRVFLNVI